MSGVRVETGKNKRQRECPSYECEMELAIITASFVLEAKALRGGSTKRAFLRRLCLASTSLNRKEARSIIEGLGGFLERRPLADTDCGTCSKTAKALLLLTVLERRLPCIPQNLVEHDTCCPIPGCPEGHRLRVCREDRDPTALALQQKLCAGCEDPCEAGEAVLPIPITVAVVEYPSSRFPGE